VNDPIAGIRQDEIPQCSDVLWFDLTNVLGCHGTAKDMSEFSINRVQAQLSAMFNGGSLFI
jgi:hypothetical protein